MSSTVITLILIAIIIYTIIAFFVPVFIFLSWLELREIRGWVEDMACNDEK